VRERHLDAATRLRSRRACPRRRRR
jgi:hypothetical protein